MSITATIGATGTTITNAPRAWGQNPTEEAALRCWVETDDNSRNPAVREVETHRYYLDDDEVCSVRLATGNDARGKDNYLYDTSSRLLSDAGERVFMQAFEDAAPAGYDATEDSDGPTPWCAPWFYESTDAWYRPQLTAAQMGRRWAAMCRKAMEMDAEDQGNLPPEGEENVFQSGEVTVHLPTNRGDYHHWYPGQHGPQEAYLEIDPKEGILRVTWNAEIGNAVPMEVYHGRVLRWYFSPRLSLREVRDLMREVAPLLERVCAGYSEEVSWRGNREGVLDADARAASAEIAELCEEASDD